MTKLKKKKQNQIAMDETENKIQLEIINVNKLNAIKRRMTKSKEKRNVTAGIIFCMAST